MNRKRTGSQPNLYTLEYIVRGIFLGEFRLSFHI